MSCPLVCSVHYSTLHVYPPLRYVYESMLKMRYSNGSRVCLLYCETGFENPSVQGPIINFNLVKPDGQVIGYSVVDRLATVHNIHLRTGCFCNTGACMTHLSISAERIEKNLKVGGEGEGGRGTERKRERGKERVRERREGERVTFVFVSAHYVCLYNSHVMHVYQPYCIQGLYFSLFKLHSGHIKNPRTLSMPSLCTL